MAININPNVAEPRKSPIGTALGGLLAAASIIQPELAPAAATVGAAKTAEAVAGAAAPTALQSVGNAAGNAVSAASKIQTGAAVGSFAQGVVDPEKSSGGQMLQAMQRRSDPAIDPGQTSSILSDAISAAQQAPKDVRDYATPMLNAASRRLNRGAY